MIAFVQKTKLLGGKFLPAAGNIATDMNLVGSVGEGFGGYVLFVIQMSDVKYLHPNDTTDPAFGVALREAADAGVTVLAVDCSITEDSMVIGKPVPIIL